MNKEDVQQLAEQALNDLEASLQAGHSKLLIRYLDVMSRFHNYSFGNCLLIHWQKPDATYVAGFRRWLQMGRFVRKGERGIGIIAPMVYRRHEAESNDSHDERVIRGFKVVHVFDLSQTEGEELPELARVSGHPAELLDNLEWLVHESDIKLLNATLPRGTKGLSRKGEIVLSNQMDNAERFSVLVHELAHEWLHDTTQRTNLSLTVRETEAEAVSYVVCRCFGLDGSTHSSDYIQMYQGTSQTLMASLDRIQKTALQIIDCLNVSRAISRESACQSV